MFEAHQLGKWTEYNLLSFLMGYIRKRRIQVIAWYVGLFYYRVCVIERLNGNNFIQSLCSNKTKFTVRRMVNNTSVYKGSFRTKYFMSQISVPSYQLQSKPFKELVKHFYFEREIGE